MSSKVVEDDDDVIFVMERKSMKVKIGNEQVPLRNIDIINDERTKRRQQEKQKKRKRNNPGTATNLQSPDRASKKRATQVDLDNSTGSANAGSSNAHLQNNNLSKPNSSHQILDYFKFLECQFKENPCGCKEFEPTSSDNKQCTCGHRRGNHKKVEKSEWEKKRSSTAEPIVKDSTTITNSSTDSNVSMQHSSSESLDVPSSASEHEGPVAESSPLKNNLQAAPEPPLSPITHSTEEDIVVDMTDSHGECIRLDMDSDSEPEAAPERPKHYPMIPYYSCPPQLQRKMNQLTFKKRIVVEKFISSNEIEWSQLDDHTFKRIKEAVQMEDVIKCVEDKIKNKKQAQYLVHLGETDKDGFTATKNRAWLMNATVSADSITFEGPYMEETNRVIREYKPDRFLRVTFNITGSGEFKLKKVFRAVLRNGIWFAGRYYEFLCFSASQLREQKCYFFASQGLDLPPEAETAGDVRAWLGNFDNIASLAKLGARLGQPFSRTVPTVVAPLDQVKQIPDIERNGYCFTDGCGEISPEFAKRIQKELGLEDLPSAFQVRWGPCKGVLMLNNNIHDTVHFRKSMWKYEIPHPTNSQLTIEVIKYSKALKGHLNRQFIVLLEGLGVPTEYFVKIQEEAINQLLDITRTKKAALSCLQSDDKADSLQSKAVGMLLAGHDPDEPYLRNLLLQIQENQLNQIKEKARIPVRKSRVLLGVCDSRGFLKPDEVFVQVKTGRPLTKKVAVSKNPCVHPGDFRLLQAVDIPELRHMVDVIVFPTTGDRPIADQIAGGDLDGDQFFVTWDSELTKIETYPPMDYRQNSPPSLPIPENYVPALQDYFVESMFSTALGVISNLHTKFADMYGPKDNLSIELAQLHSRAVDAAKTGDIVKIPDYISHHNEKRWPHFMGKEDCYTSKRCLGVLYNKVLDRLKLLRDGTMKDVVMDPALLLKGREVYALEARKNLRDYNSSMTKALCISDPDLKSKAIENIVQRFRKIFETVEKIDSDDTSGKRKTRQNAKKEDTSQIASSDIDSRFNLALYLKASAWYEATYQEKKSKDGKPAPSMSHALTFAWNICDDYLNRIKADAGGAHGRLAPTVGTDVVKDLSFRG